MVKNNARGGKGEEKRQRKKQKQERRPLQVMTVSKRADICLLLPVITFNIFI